MFGGELEEETMAYWLLKTEPDVFSWDDQVKRGAKGEPWTGVRNFTARRYLKEMKKGERALFYHTGEEKQVVGIAEVIRESYHDPTDEQGGVARGGRQGGQAVPEPGHAGGGQSRAAAQGDGAGEISAAIGAAGDRAGVEDRVRPRRREGLIHREADVLDQLAVARMIAADT